MRPSRSEAAKAPTDKFRPDITSTDPLHDIWVRYKKASDTLLDQLQFIPFLFTSLVKCLLSTKAEYRTFGALLIFEIEDIATNYFSNDRITYKGVTKFDPRSLYPQRYCGGLTPLTVGCMNISYTGTMSEHYWKEPDQWSSTKDQQRYIYLGLECVLPDEQFHTGVAVATAADHAKEVWTAMSTMKLNQLLPPLWVNCPPYNKNKYGCGRCNAGSYMFAFLAMGDLGFSGPFSTKTIEKIHNKDNIRALLTKPLTYENACPRRIIMGIRHQTRRSDWIMNNEYAWKQFRQEEKKAEDPMINPESLRLMAEALASAPAELANKRATDTNTVKANRAAHLKKCQEAKAAAAAAKCNTAAVDPRSVTGTAAIDTPGAFTWEGRVEGLDSPT